MIFFSHRVHREYTEFTENTQRTQRIHREHRYFKISVFSVVFFLLCVLCGKKNERILYLTKIAAASTVVHRLPSAPRAALLVCWDSTILPDI